MSEIIKIEKTIYSSTINNVIDTQFNQLIPPTVPTTATSDVTVAQFFDNYTTLFYDIPLSGSDNTHLGLANRSLEHLGLSLDNMQSEIEYLRQENTELKNQILQSSKIDIGTFQDL
jgi:hypothetical protein